MKRHFVGVLAVLLLGIISWAQESKIPFDMRKSQEELEIMKGILRTTLSFITQSSQKQNLSIFRSSNIDAFHLRGQGAVFVIPASDLRISNNTDFASPFVEQAQSRELDSLIKVYSEQVALQATELALNTWGGHWEGNWIWFGKRRWNRYGPRYWSGFRNRSRRRPGKWQPY